MTREAHCKCRIAKPILLDAMAELEMNQANATSTEK